MHSTHNGLEEEDCEEANVNNRAGLNKIPKCLCVSCWGKTCGYCCSVL